MLRGIPPNQRWNWEKRDKKRVPAEHVLALYEQRVNEAGGPPPPDPFAGYAKELVYALKMLTAYYRAVVADAPKPDHWVGMLAGFRNGLEQADADTLAALMEGEDDASA